MDDQGAVSVLAPDWYDSRESALAQSLAEPEAALALSLPSSLGAIGSGRSIVAAAIRPDRTLIDAIAMLQGDAAAPATTADTESTEILAFVGPPDPGHRPSGKSLAAAATVTACGGVDGEFLDSCDELAEDALVSADSPSRSSVDPKFDFTRWRHWNPGAVVGPEIPREAACEDFDGGDFVGPSARERHRAPRTEIVPPSIELDLREPITLRDYDGDAFVGAPAPAPVGADLRADAMSDLADYDGDAFVGPPLPAMLGPNSAHADHQPHGLPFDPLREPAFRESAAAAGADSPADLAAILADVEEYHTVRYVHEVAHKVASGETLSEVLAKVGGLGAGEVERWLSAARAHYNPNKVYAGQIVSLLVDMPEGRARRMKLESSRDSIVIVEAKADGVTARKEEIPYERNLKVFSGTIEQSLYVDAVEHGLPEKVIAEMAEILGWDINFGRDLRPGAHYLVAYEELTRLDTLASRAGRVMAVEVENRDKKYEGFYFAEPDGSGGAYYDRKGEGLGRAFLRYPVAFNRISSHFSTKRFHPVLKRNVPHYGVDFAAPTGTPVKAVADGVVSRAGWYGGNGRFVKMKHDAVYESGYAHLSRIASGIKSGVRVKQGQIIGYVGSTGLATGPHLHYAMYRNGAYIDPLKAGLPRRRALTGNELARFNAQRDTIDAVYAKHAREPVEVARAPGQSAIEQD